MIANSALQLMLPAAAAALTTGRNPERTGNAGWLGSPGADTLSVVSNESVCVVRAPTQFISKLHLVPSRVPWKKKHGVISWLRNQVATLATGGLRHGRESYHECC